MIIDIHAHLPEPERTCSVSDVLADMDAHNIDIRVLSSLQGWRMQAGNTHTAEVIAQAPERLLGCAVADPREPDAARLLDETLSVPGMAMVEFNSFEHAYYPDVHPHIDELLCVARDHKVPVKLFSGLGCHSLPQQWMKHIKAHPEINFVMLHMGCFDYGYGCIDLVKEVDNLYLEISNQYEVQILRKAYECVPPEKLCLGTLWPERLTISAFHAFDMCKPHAAFYEAVYAKTAERILGGIR